MDDALERRIEALERAVTDGEHDLSALAADGETAERLDTVESRLDDIADRVAELEAATQAVRGYVGNVRSVNRDIEQRADAALAKAESLEAAVTDETFSGTTGETTPASATQSSDHEPTDSPGEVTASTPDETAAGDSAGAARNGQSNAASQTTGVASQTTGAASRTTGTLSGSAPERAESGTGETSPDAGTSTDPVAGGSAGSTHSAEANDDSGTSGHHCEACGRPAPAADVAKSQQQSPANTGAAGATAGSESGTAGVKTNGVAPEAGTNSTATGAGTNSTATANAQTETGPAALDPEFRAENGDDDPGTFERIRKLL